MIAKSDFLCLILQIIEVCIVSVITSVISFGLPLFRKCTSCPEADPNSGIECPRPPGMYGNYVNVRSSVTVCLDFLHLSRNIAFCVLFHFAVTCVALLSNNGEILHLSIGVCSTYYMHMHYNVCLHLKLCRGS